MTELAGGALLPVVSFLEDATMKLFTCTLFTKLPPEVSMVCVARFAPASYHGLIDLRLAPMPAWLKLDREEYTRLFTAMLSKLDLLKVAERWDGHALACFCNLKKAGCWCHRELIADALRALGVEVEEID